MMARMQELLWESLVTLCESVVSVDKINQAMDERRRIIITYHSKGEDNNTGPRLIEIYAYGLTKAGNPVIRAFQPYGDTTSSIPSWKFFRLDRISSWKDTGQVFNKPANEYYPGIGDFNPNGDDTMQTVYKIVSFGKEATAPSQGVAANKGPRTKGEEQPVYQTDTEKRMQSLRRQMQHPIKLDDLLPQKNSQQPQQHGPKTKTSADTQTTQQPTQSTQPTEPTQQSDNNVAPTTPSQESPMSFAEFNRRLRNGENLFKTDTERGMENLRKQLENPKKIDLSQIPRR